jgi:hypothetical protein
MKNWQLVQELFEATVDLAPHERARLVRERAAGNPALQQLLDDLADADHTPLPAFERSPAELFAALRPEPPPQALCGLEFGAYHIEEHLSSGGMGHVYRATRSAAGTERRVALKVLRPSLDPQAFLARFERERLVLAALEHERIVAFLDAGALPDGRPFLVMEYVDGQPITHWARAARASRRRRIELFIEVCAAVQYAHHQLVVHRDLKPSNVLVTAQGVPKLLDFGVASILERSSAADLDGGSASAPDRASAGAFGSSSDATLEADSFSGHTAEPEPEARTPLTPAYAAPEALAGARPSAANDVYSLGVLLRELLTDERDPATPPPTLDRDLSAILAKATEPNPTRRYASVERLSDDLRRQLAHEPIAARGGGPGYRAACFLRRRRWSLLSAAAILAALIVGWISSDLARRDAQTDAARGWRAHAEVKALARVLEGWILESASSDPARASRAAAHLEAALTQDLAEFPEAETLVRLTLAQLHLERSELAQARVHAERAWELAQTTSGIGVAERTRAAELRSAVASTPTSEAAASESESSDRD